ncbi:MAG TPA: PilN domain-containing protein [Desulfomonilia bacterium]|nr:PilN domain-containing protein [Desulfomonilia bacterium]
MVKINLLPIRLELRKKALVEHVVLLALCIFIVLIFEWFVQATITSQRDSLIREVATTKMEIKKLTAEAGEIEKFKQQKQELEKKLDVIQDLNAKKTGPVEILDELSMIIPEKAWLTSLSNKGDSMVLEGQAMDNTTIATFMKQLQGSKHFDNVTLVLSQQEGGRQKFSITCKIKMSA